ncbi:hypothetical protein BCR34DRAFT_249339 [Clohesyomyces aquaticus]|uniref:WD40-repeat-containing domain protein n=1 Tax=Clohesyomyces aquaticus TaxID=1231657 RepID=A0A1Y1ZUM8_9PLEO|nr:hypothetical protein BCR34DRAFT_249339 [Clohesyomyces aquaticus]
MGFATVDASYLATWSADHTARIWSVDTSQPHNVRLRLSTDRPRCQRIPSSDHVARSSAMCTCLFLARLCPLVGTQQPIYYSPI